jgi:hypothetical protein
VQELFSSGFNHDFVDCGFSTTSLFSLIETKKPDFLHFHSHNLILSLNRTNHHEGNKRYRKMVEGRKVDYVNSKRLDKPLVALDIIKIWRDQKPPGRFLKYDEKLDLWNDVGDKKAREKTSQALREKAPLLRKQQEEQKREELEGAGSSETASPKAEVRCGNSRTLPYFKENQNYTFCSQPF